MSLKWNGSQVFGQVEDRIRNNVERALAHLVDALQENLNTPYPPASDPGEFPHKRTGNLQASVYYQFDRRRFTGDIIVDAPYAVYLEEGTQKMQERPFLQPTIDAEMGTIIEIISE